jgi:peptidoglycan-associated lipoprotein
MTKRTIQWLMMATALSLTGACASRRTNQLPPDPPSATTPDGSLDGTGSQGQNGGAAVPGSRADFIQSVPSDRVFFELDSYSLSADARRILDGQAQWLLRNTGVNVTIEGHADERGTREYNLALGDRRANAARDYLQSRGVGAQRMQVISWGKERPAVEGASENAYAQNRRAVTVLPE